MINVSKEAHLLSIFGNFEAAARSKITSFADHCWKGS